MKKLFGAVAFASLVGGTALIAKQMVVKPIPLKDWDCIYHACEQHCHEVMTDDPANIGRCIDICMSKSAKEEC